MKIIIISVLTSILTSLILIKFHLNMTTKLIKKFFIEEEKVFENYFKQISQK